MTHSCKSQPTKFKTAQGVISYVPKLKNKKDLLLVQQVMLLGIIPFTQVFISQKFIRIYQRRVKGNRFNRPYKQSIQSMHLKILLNHSKFQTYQESLGMMSKNNLKVIIQGIRPTDRELNNLLLIILSYAFLFQIALEHLW